MIRKIKWFVQRIITGWDDRTLWDLDYHIAKFVLPRLKEFKKNLHNHPGCFNTLEEWDDVLDKIVYSFEHIINDLYMLDKEVEEIRQIEEKIQEGLELFGKYFRGLWT